MSEQLRGPSCRLFEEAKINPNEFKIKHAVMPAIAGIPAVCVRVLHQFVLQDLCLTGYIKQCTKE